MYLLRYFTQADCIHAVVITVEDAMHQSLVEFLERVTCLIERRDRIAGPSDTIVDMVVSEGHAKAQIHRSWNDYGSNHGHGTTPKPR